ncbi:MAG: 3-oxoacyl-ACP synthase [Flavobacteriaceae bacterium]|nr:3-oxoacyl-ACP synthase [Flavobacteriaceae bacterium]
MDLKTTLIDECKRHVNVRLQNIQDTILSNQKALQSETKSSAGDKHETGRAMLQLEIEKAGKQLLDVEQMLLVLQKINSKLSSNKIGLGSVVETDEMNFFISVSVGKLIISNTTYFAISPVSPIGKIMLGKSVNQQIIFNGKTLNIRLVK